MIEKENKKTHPPQADGFLLPLSKNLFFLLKQTILVLNMTQLI